jgi:hypothetical protein
LNNKLSKIVIFSMKYIVFFCFGDARPKSNLLISNFTIFESLLLGLGDIKKNHLTIIVEEIIAIFNNIAINAIKTMTSKTTN